MKLCDKCMTEIKTIGKNRLMIELFPGKDICDNCVKDFMAMCKIFIK